MAFARPDAIPGLNDGIAGGVQRQFRHLADACGIVQGESKRQRAALAEAGCAEVVEEIVSEVKARTRSIGADLWQGHGGQAPQNDRVVEAALEDEHGVEIARTTASLRLVQMPAPKALEASFG